MSQPSFQVVTYGWERHAGLRHDAGLLQQALIQLGQSAALVKRPTYRTLSWRILLSRKAHAVGADRVVRTGLEALSRAQRRVNRLPNRATLHVQYPSPRHLVNGALQVLVPNPEWFWDQDAWALPFIDVVFCKTRHAVPIFASEGCAAEYIGFTSEDRRVPGIKPDRWQWLHIASNGHQKGTDEIVEAWLKHPDWPQLTVVASKRTVPTPTASNLRVIDEWLEYSELRTLMQRCGVHVCPSNAEGFGHTIVEAMSCGVLVLTTDLEPMNELVDEDRGLLVDVAETTPMGWARRATFSQEALEAAVERAIGLSDAEYTRRARAAREWYLSNDVAFRRRLGAFAQRLTQPAASIAALVD